MDFNGYSSQVLSWIEGVQKSRGIDTDTTLQLCENIKKYAKERVDEQLLGYAYYYSGETYYLRNDVDNLFQNISDSLSYLEHSRQHGLLARAYNILAITSMNRGNAPFAMDYYLNALFYCNKYKLYEVGIMVNINIGTLYNHFGEYKQALHYLERSYRLLQEHTDIIGYCSYLMNIYVGIGNNWIHREQLLRAQDYILRVKEECADGMEPLDEIVFFCYEARVYNLIGKSGQRDECMAKIDTLVTDQMPILDIFDDLYEYAEMLFSIGDMTRLWKLLDMLEQMAKQSKIINMQKRLLVLKLRYYRLKNNNAGYLQAAGLFFELSELLEKENRYMVSSMLNMRYSLEESQKSKRKMEEENQILLERSQTDALSGLANRYRLNSFAEEAFARAVEGQRALAVEILDIDYFKQYNDNYGHQAGDTCIRKISGALRELADKGDIFCARYGGDEFIIIYEGYSLEEVSDMAAGLKQVIMDMNIEHVYSMAIPIVTITQGICYDVPDEASKMWDFLHMADGMLYRAKEKSRNTVYLGSLQEE